MARVRIGLRLRFLKLPHVDGERVFRDVIAFDDPEDRDYDDLRAIVEAKIRFMELRCAEFTVFYKEENTCDRLVVDTALFNALLRQWSRKVQKGRAARTAPVLVLLGDSCPYKENGIGETAQENDDDDDDETRAPHLLESFEIELRQCSGPTVGAVLASATPAASRPTPLAMLAPPRLAQCAALTRENLARLCTTPSPHVKEPLAAPFRSSPDGGDGNSSPTSPTDPNAEVHVQVRSLTCPPTHPKFFLRCIILAIRFKTPKPGITVAELDLGEESDIAQLITAVTFDDVVHKAIRDHLRGDRRQVLELRQVYVRRKTDIDVRYQTNSHPFVLRVDRSSKLEVVRILATPATGGSSGVGGSVITVREQLEPAAVVDVSQLMGLQHHRRVVRSIGASSTENGPLFTLGGGAYPPPLSSSSSSSGPRRTTFTMSSSGSGGNTGASTALISGVVPSAYGQELRARQELLLRAAPATPAVLEEPGVPLVTTRDVRQREPLLEQHASRDAQRKERIRRKTEVSTRCLLCGLDCSDEEGCMAVVREQLTRSSRNRGTQIPSFEQLKRDLSDRRRVAEGKPPTRLLCAHTFVKSSTRTVHVVHPRCAHLCTAYQNGGELEDIVEYDLSMSLCALCGMPGAPIACYHPKCTEAYHVVCALYSGGYVNFGQRDPFLPCSACPRHTHVSIATARSDGSRVLHVDHSCWEDGVAFDSRVVASTDLRDPDENDGE